MSNQTLPLSRSFALGVSERSVSALKQLLQERDSLFARLQSLQLRTQISDSNSDSGSEESGDQSPAPVQPLSLAEEVALSMGQSLQVFAGTHIDAALSCLAHNRRAFDSIKAEIEPAMVEHLLDSARDDIAYGPLMGFSAEAVGVADMFMVEEHVRAARAIHDRISALLAQSEQS
ncbi:MAG: hypothetical protein BWY75_00968 [bacterium ADurb.Bin425]|jgi:hypothetical protein|nr:MAG: hypothetical protein BWY75_00968 [bacterium ADurb.Bin425]